MRQPTGRRRLTRLASYKKQLARARAEGRLCECCGLPQSLGLEPALALLAKHRLERQTRMLQAQCDQLLDIMDAAGVYITLPGGDQDTIHIHRTADLPTVSELARSQTMHPSRGSLEGIPSKSSVRKARDAKAD
jgi:hypothetical protein